MRASNIMTSRLELSPTTNLRHKCPLCMGIFKGRPSLNTHLLTHTRVKEYSCSKCSKQFTQKSTLEVHVKSVHLKIKPYKCSVCNSTFSQSTALKGHLVTHDKKKSYPCPLCPAVFGSKVEVSRHLNSAKHAGKRK